MDNMCILIVDDEPNIVDVVKSYLDSAGYKTYTAYNGQQAMHAYEKFNPDLIILDLMLPDFSGEEICSRIRMKSNVPIIMLTAKVDEDNVIAQLNAGADDYISKPFSPRQLVARVNAVLRRSGNEPGLITDIFTCNNGEIVVDLNKHILRRQSIEVSLTPNEFNIIKTLIKNPGRTYTREELIMKSSGEDFDGFDRIIDTHIKNIRQKLEIDPKTPKYILTVHGIGYKFTTSIT